MTQLHHYAHGPRRSLQHVIGAPLPYSYCHPPKPAAATLLHSNLHAQPTALQGKRVLHPRGTLLRLNRRCFRVDPPHTLHQRGQQGCVAGASPCCCQETAATRCPNTETTQTHVGWCPAGTQHVLTHACLSAGLCACLCTGQVHSSCRWCCCCEQALTPQSRNSLLSKSRPTNAVAAAAAAAILLHDTQPLSPHMRPHLHTPYWRARRSQPMPSR